MRKSADHAVRYSFKLLKYDERDRCDVNKQSKCIWCVLNEFCTNQNKIKYENEQNKRILWIKRKESVKNDVINNNDKIFQYDKTRNTSRLRECDKNNERMLRKSNNEIEKND